MSMPQEVETQNSNPETRGRIILTTQDRIFQKIPHRVGIMPM